jgi:DNA polymerase I-like protein with 3'-5' exonuclease and polymerase domains
VQKHGTTKPFLIDSELAPIYREMGSMGVWINERVRAEMSFRLRTEKKEKEEQFRVVAHQPKINLNSYKQLQSWLYGDLGLTPPLTTKGKEFKDANDEAEASTGAPAILRLIELGVESHLEDALNLLLEYKAIEQLRRMYVDNLPVRYRGDFDYLLGTVPAFEWEGKEILPPRSLLSWLFITWKLHITPSGRSSSSPNIQNWPSRAWRGINMKRLIVAPPGHCFVFADLEQIESRLYAIDSGDQILLKAIREGLDVHSLNAAMIFTRERDPDSPIVKQEYLRIVNLPKGAKKRARDIAKTVQYALNYGAGVTKLYDVFRVARDKVTLKRLFPNVSRADAESWGEAWHHAHPTQAWGDSIDAFEREYGYVMEEIHGRKRFFPGGPNKPDAPKNMSIQGKAGARKNEAVLGIHKEIPFRKWSKYTGLCRDIHDDVGVCVPLDRAEEAIRIVEKHMTGSYRGLALPCDKPKAVWDWAG